MSVFVNDLHITMKIKIVVKEIIKGLAVIVG